MACARHAAPCTLNLIHTLKTGSYPNRRAFCQSLREEHRSNSIWTKDKMPLKILRKSLGVTCEDTLSQEQRRIHDEYPLVLRANEPNSRARQSAKYHVERYNRDVHRKAVVCRNGGSRSEKKNRGALISYHCITPKCKYSHSMRRVIISAKHVQEANKLCSKKGHWINPEKVGINKVLCIQACC